ncbi:MAG: signal peptidase II [Nitrospiraceae bacterium]|nr:MAG: signal peptidase II [Nitrospiraceae bacterium]
MKKNIITPFISLAVVFFDYITKRLIVSNVTPFEHIDVLPFLRIVHVENKGAAFGIMSNLDNRFFIAISIIAITTILIYAYKAAKGTEIYALSLILGGATGNLIDRFISGKVIDFIDFYIGKWHWPSFNVADSALTVGIAIFIWSNFNIRKA